MLFRLTRIKTGEQLLQADDLRTLLGCAGRLVHSLLDIVVGLSGAARLHHRQPNDVRRWLEFRISVWDL